MINDIWSKSDNKYEARQRVIQPEYKELTGRNKLPSTQQYWALCGRQKRYRRSELTQLVDIGLITLDQYHGIDNDREVIKRNRRSFPEAHFYHGDWKRIIAEQKPNPGIIHLDTTSMPYNASKLFTATLLEIKKGFILYVNVVLAKEIRTASRDNLSLGMIYHSGLPSRQLKRIIDTGWHYEYPGVDGNTLMGIYCYKIRRLK